jgi:hypothetical protein
MRTVCGSLRSPAWFILFAEVQALQAQGGALQKTGLCCFTASMFDQPQLQHSLDLAISSRDGFPSTRLLNGFGMNGVVALSVWSMATA